jgi:hypothetical protein
MTVTGYEWLVKSRCREPQRSSAQRKSILLLTTDGSDRHNQAPGQVRGRATEGWPEGRIETLGQVEKDCRKAAPKEERVGKTCESNERERTSQIGRQKNHRVDSLSECWICCGKDPRKRACGCFFTTHPRLETKRKLVFFPRDFWAKQGHLRSRMSDVFSQSRASSLAKGFETAAPAWLVQAQPCVPLSSSVPIRVIRGSKFIALRVSIPAWRF